MNSPSELETIANGIAFAPVAREPAVALPPNHGIGFKVAVLAGDLAAAGLAAAGANWLAALFGHDIPRPQAFALTMGALAACWVAGLIAGRLYTFRPARQPSVWAVQVLVCLGGGTLCAVAISYLFAVTPLPDRHHYLLATLLAWPLVLSVRLLGVRYGPPDQVRERLLILGTCDRASALATSLLSSNPLGAELLGAIALPSVPTARDFPCPVLGEIGDCLAIAHERRANTLVVAPALPLPAEVVQCAAHCDAMGLGVWTWETAYEELTWRAPVFHVGEVWQASLESARRSRYASRLKRYADVVLALLLMPLALLIIGGCAALIKLCSRGPVFYRQDRVGKDGQLFSFLKLRTMVVDAEKGTGPVWATEDDPRVTRLGRFLRKTRLDEVPQLFLVLRGDMSLIGPRPERPFFVQRFKHEIPLYEKRLMVRPGITGWAQIHHNYDRNTDDVIEKLRYDLYYVRHLSFSLDLQIILKTFGVMLTKKGAH